MTLKANEVGAALAIGVDRSAAGRRAWDAILRSAEGLWNAGLLGARRGDDSGTVASARSSTLERPTSAEIAVVRQTGRFRHLRWIPWRPSSTARLSSPVQNRIRLERGIGPRAHFFMRVPPNGVDQAIGAFCPAAAAPGWVSPADSFSRDLRWPWIRAKGPSVRGKRVKGELRAPACGREPGIRRATALRVGSTCRRRPRALEWSRVGDELAPRGRTSLHSVAEKGSTSPLASPITQWCLVRSGLGFSAGGAGRRTYPPSRKRSTFPDPRHASRRAVDLSAPWVGPSLSSPPTPRLRGRLSGNPAVAAADDRDLEPIRVRKRASYGKFASARRQ